MHRTWWAGVALLLGLLLTPLRAAASPATANSIQIGLGFRYGIEMNEGDFNPWGLGLGVDAGYTLPNAVYVGGVFDYFFGETVEVAGSELSGNTWHLMAEGGYDVGLIHLFVIRPKLGLGIGTLSTETCLTGIACDSDSQSKLAVAPGATLLFMPPAFSVSLDLRLPIIFAEGETVKALVFSLGIGF